MPDDTKDYAKSGLDIQYAMMDRAKALESKKLISIRWGKHEVRTADSIPVLESGVVRGEFLTVKDGTDQGFDLNCSGYLELDGGQKVSLLRTWYNRDLPSAVEYPFYSADRRIWVWNVYKRKYGGGQSVEEKWTGNAGLWIEQAGQAERIYHCSHGAASPPDFESLVFKITIKSA